MVLNGIAYYDNSLYYWMVLRIMTIVYAIEWYCVLWQQFILLNGIVYNDNSLYYKMVLRIMTTVYTIEWYCVSSQQFMLLIYCYS